MISLNQIRLKVLEAVNHRHRDVIIGVYRRMMLSHKSSCGCDYCQLHGEYVRERIRHHRLKRVIFSDDYVPFDSYESDVGELEKHGIHVMNLRQHCNKLKRLDGGI